jgi:hypothetical protein
VPLVYWLKQRDPKWASANVTDRDRAVGEELREMVIAGGSITRRSGRVRNSTGGEVVAADEGGGVATRPAPTAAATSDPTKLLTHPPRPRKKSRR